jgi:hypothetical protein
MIEMRHVAGVAEARSNDFATLIVDESYFAIADKRITVVGRLGRNRRRQSQEN